MMESSEFLTNMTVFLVLFALFAAGIGMISFGMGRKNEYDEESIEISKKIAKILLNSFFPSFKDFQTAQTKKQKFMAIFGFLSPVFDFEELLEELKIKEKYPRAEIIIPIVRLGIFMLIFILVFIFISDTFYGISIIDKNGDISNTTTLIVEIGIAIFLGISLLTYSNFDQRQNREMMKKNQTTLDATTTTLGIAIRKLETMGKTMQNMKDFISKQEEITQEKEAKEETQREYINRKIISFLGRVLYVSEQYSNLLENKSEIDMIRLSFKSSNPSGPFKELSKALKDLAIISIPRSPRFDTIEKLISNSNDLISVDTIHEVNKVISHGKDSIFYDGKKVPLSLKKGMEHILKGYISQVSSLKEILEKESEEK